MAKVQASKTSESLDMASSLSMFRIRPLKFRGPKARQPTPVHCTSSELFFLFLICLVVGVITLILLRYGYVEN